MRSRAPGSGPQAPGPGLQGSRAPGPGLQVPWPPGPPAPGPYPPPAGHRSHPTVTPATTPKNKKNYFLSISIKNLLTQYYFHDIINT